jgi:hypothetical protein
MEPIFRASRRVGFRSFFICCKKYILYYNFNYLNTNDANFGKIVITAAQLSTLKKKQPASAGSSSGAAPVAISPCG